MSGMIYVRPFGQVSPTVTIAGGSGVAAVTRAGMGTQTVRVVNAGTATVFLEFGKDASVVANAATSMRMLGGQVETFLLPNDITHIAATGGDGDVSITTWESA